MKIDENLIIIMQQISSIMLQKAFYFSSIFTLKCLGYETPRFVQDSGSKRLSLCDAGPTAAGAAWVAIFTHSGTSDSFRRRSPRVYTNNRMDNAATKTNTSQMVGQ